MAWILSGDYQIAVVACALVTLKSYALESPVDPNTKIKLIPHIEETDVRTHARTGISIMVFKACDARR